MSSNLFIVSFFILVSSEISYLWWWIEKTATEQEKSSFDMGEKKNIHSRYWIDAAYKLFGIESTKKMQRQQQRTFLDRGIDRSVCTANTLKPLRTKYWVCLFTNSFLILLINAVQTVIISLIFVCRRLLYSCYTEFNLYSFDWTCNAMKSLTFWEEVLPCLTANGRILSPRFY